MKTVSIITDGACLGNPGRGGWACILRSGTVKKELFGFDPETTNNRMELMAAIQGLLALKEPCQVDVTTDAEYVRQGITVWVHRWKRRYWWKRMKRPVINADLWIELDELAAQHKVTWEWTKGHAGHADNNRCDLLARNAAAHQKSSWPDNRMHGELKLNLGRGYIPPRPQLSLFDEIALEAEQEEDDPEDPG